MASGQVMLSYEFRSYNEEGNDEQVAYDMYKSDSSARSAAGAIAKRRNGPCDLARLGSEDWADRYMTTATPSQYHTAGYACERLA